MAFCLISVPGLLVSAVLFLGLQAIKAIAEDSKKGCKRFILIFFSKGISIHGRDQQNRLK